MPVFLWPLLHYIACLARFPCTERKYLISKTKGSFFHALNYFFFLIFTCSWVNISTHNVSVIYLFLPVLFYGLNSSRLAFYTTSPVSSFLPFIHELRIIIWKTKLSPFHWYEMKKCKIKLWNKRSRMTQHTSQGAFTCRYDQGSTKGLEGPRHSPSGWWYWSNKMHVSTWINRGHDMASGI